MQILRGPCPSIYINWDLYWLLLIWISGKHQLSAENLLLLHGKFNQARHSTYMRCLACQRAHLRSSYYAIHGCYSLYCCAKTHPYTAMSKCENGARIPRSCTPFSCQCIWVRRDILQSWKGQRHRSEIFQHMKKVLTILLVAYKINKPLSWASYTIAMLQTALFA